MLVYNIVHTGTKQNGGYGACLYIGKASRFPKCCTSQNATGAGFLEGYIPLCVIALDWDILVSCVKCWKRAKIQRDE